MNEVDQLKERISVLEAEVKESERQRRTYLQNVAHQLTAPLGAIKWSIEAMKDEGIPLARKGNLLRSVYSQSTILVHLIKNFALMSNLEADEEFGQMHGEDSVDLMRLAINLANDFQPQAFDADRKKIAVDDISFKTVLRGRQLKLEKNLIAQAISNLLENAVKYGDPDTTITVRAEQIEAIGISVTSVGIPIDPNDVGKLAQRGYRSVAARKKIAAGTGIGLYLASRVMQLHQGKLIIHVTGRESRFTLVFPQARLL
jgi:two-component system, OmpR family, phosphate regulon sensor histidine kinase PhoR